MAYPKPVEALVEAFQQLPGIGRVTAERLAFHVLREPSSIRLATAIQSALEEARRCNICGNICEQETCSLCSDPARDASTLIVVEEPRHVEALEKAGIYRGRYHVLMGALNPADGTEARHLSLQALLQRLDGGEVQELILGTDPDREGEATALLVLEAVDGLEQANLRVTRLARGLPAGSAIEYLHKGVLEDALSERRSVRVQSRGEG